MATVTTSRRQGINSSAAVKVPCRAATTANITLSGEQTVDGVALVADDRCLVKDQTTGSENGIYIVSTSTWQRAPDFDGALDVVTGTIVKIVSGTANAGLFYELTTANPITIGTTSLTFSALTSNLSGVSAFAETLLDDTTAADARTTLGGLLTLTGTNLLTNTNSFEYGINYVAAAGTDTYTATLAPAITNLRTGATFNIFFTNANTSTTPTININSLGAKTIKLRSGNAVLAGQISGPHTLFYDGTDMLVLTLPRHNFRGALVKHSASQNITNNNATVLSWNQEEYDTDSFHDTSTNNSRLTVPSGVARIECSASANFSADAGNDYTELYLQIIKNGALFQGSPQSTIGTFGVVSTPNICVTTPVVEVSAGDYFEARAYQQNTSTGTNTVTSDSRTWFSIKVIE